MPNKTYVIDGVEYALVPVEPTPESLMAMHSAYWGSEPSLHWHENSGPLWRKAYDAMLAAAPAPATVATEDGAEGRTPYTCYTDGQHKRRPMKERQSAEAAQVWTQAQVDAINAEARALHDAGRQKPQAEPVAQGGGVDDASLEAIIEESSGEWRDDEFRVTGSDLMAMLRKAALLTAAPAIANQEAQE